MVIKLAPEGFSYRTLADLSEADLLEEKKNVKSIYCWTFMV